MQLLRTAQDKFLECHSFKTEKNTAKWSTSITPASVVSYKTEGSRLSEKKGNSNEKSESA